MPILHNCIQGPAKEMSGSSGRWSADNAIDSHQALGNRYLALLMDSVCASVSND